MKEMNRFALLGDRVPQFVAVFAATVSAISDGMSYGWASPVIPILKSPETPVVIQESDIVWIESIYMIGGLFGLPLTIYSVDKFGRKLSIIFAACMNLLHWVLLSVSTNMPMLYIARLITGIAGDMAFVATPMYIAEIADQKIRGFLASIIYIMMLVGILVVYSVAPFVSIPISSSVGALFLCFQLVSMPFIPESPYYLFIKGKEEQARKSLQFFRGNVDIEKEVQEIHNAVLRQKEEKGRCKDLIMVKSNRKAIIIMGVLNAAQHFSSISVILMNLHTILNDAAAIISSNTASIIFSVVMIFAAISASTIVDKAGRKALLATSSLFTGLSLVTLAVYFNLKNTGYDVTSFNWVPVAAVMLYAVAFKCGLGLVPIVLTAELFPTSVKAMGMTISDAMYVIFSCISIYLYNWLWEAYGLHVPFYIFAASCVLTALFALLYIPETKGKTLEEIQFILKGKSYQPPTAEIKNTNIPMNGSSQSISNKSSSDSSTTKL